MTKKVLYITTDITFTRETRAGGGAVQLSHLNILSLLGYEIQIIWLHLHNSKLTHPIHKKKYSSYKLGEKEISIDKVELLYPKKKVVSAWTKLNHLLSNHVSYYYTFLHRENLQLLQEVINQTSANFVWAQWFYSGLLCSRIKMNKKVVYVHHDWQYKLAKFKNENSSKTSFIFYMKRKIERGFVKKMDAAISVSYTDLSIFEQMKIPSIYIPTTYDALAFEVKETQKDMPSLVHLGSLKTTANRVGLKNFLANCWDEIKKQLPQIELKIIGEIPESNKKFKKQLEDDPQIQAYGFVENLADVLVAYDIHLIPWDQDTGTRTRIPLIFQSKQCLVAMKEGVKNMEEVHQKNAILCTDWNSYIESIVAIFHDDQRRKEICESASKTAFDHFLHASQTRKVEAFINEVLS